MRGEGRRTWLASPVELALVKPDPKMVMRVPPQRPPVLGSTFQNRGPWNSTEWRQQGMVTILSAGADKHTLQAAAQLQQAQQQTFRAAHKARSGSKRNT